LRIFGSQRISGVMSRLGMEEGQPIEHSLITRAIENAQRRVKPTTSTSASTSWNVMMS
jgi:preprotein translocase subunit SecA